jgi:Fe-S cluster assembly scaffold protein SufB
MQSRGFTVSTAMEMIVEGYVQQILSHFELPEEEKEKVECFIKKG